MSAYHLAQLNIGIIRAPMDSAVMVDFANNLDPVNAIADSAPGFVWRLQTEEGNATSIRPFENENLLLNMSVWHDLESLRTFVYTTLHAEFLRRRREWFERMSEAYMVLWWVPRGHIPSIDEAMARLETLRHQGPTAEAFTFRRAYPPPDAASPSEPVSFGDERPAT
jgi:hypothetical protein